MAKKHLASCATCKTGISTLSLRINEHPYWIKLCYVQSTDTCAQIYCVKYHVKQFNNKWAILKKCVVLTGGLEVSFSIQKIRQFLKNWIFSQNSTGADLTKIVKILYYLKLWKEHIFAILFISLIKRKVSTKN